MYSSAYESRINLLQHCAYKRQADIEQPADGEQIMHIERTLHRTSVALLTGVITTIVLMVSSATLAQDSGVAMHTIVDKDRCSALATFASEGVTIDSARAQPANEPVPGSLITSYPGTGASISGIPAFCRVIGHFQPEPGSNIGFEVWLPSEKWNGRMNGAGNGGFAGSISYRELAAAVSAGQVGASTDTGHVGIALDSTWAKGHPERVRDYGWRAIHLTAVAAKQLISAFYGRGPDHSYFMSCSNGGRQALMEATRFPEDYDGILAGGPASVFTTVAMSMINTSQAQQPTDAAIRMNQMPLLQSEVLKQCDALDGQQDELIGDPRQCKLDTSKLACGTTDSPQCFSPAQIQALQRINAGPHDAKGHQLAPGYPAAGAEVGVPTYFGWETWILSGENGRSTHSLLANGLLTNFIAEPFATTQTFDFDKDSSRLIGALSADLDATPDMKRFFKRGGKLIMWHGWADAALPPQLTIDFHDAVLRSSGRAADKSMRLFMVPGVQHCFGGPGPDLFGQIVPPAADAKAANNLGAALQAWVESGHAPDAIVGHKGSPESEPMPAPVLLEEKQRLLCAYPLIAVLRKNSDPDKAASYVCKKSR
jgi:Tannase and feruloyl esterase